MQELGEFLRRAREERKITLDEVEKGTKIRKAYLMAIERGDFSYIPGEAYLKGFIRNYAEFIGLDGLEIIKKYKELKTASNPDESDGVQGIPGEQGQGSGQYPPQYIQELRKNRRISGKSGGTTAVLVLIILAVIIFVYMLFNNKGSGNLFPPESEPAAVERVDESPAVNSLSGIGTLEGEEQTQASSGSNSGTEPTAAPEPEAPAESVASAGQAGLPEREADHVIRQRGIRRELHRVFAVMSDDCWLKVSIGGEVYFERILRQDESLSIVSEDQVLIRIGNAAAVSLEYNGEDQGRFGEPNQVVEVTYPGGAKRVVDLSAEARSR